MHKRVLDDLDWMNKFVEAWHRSIKNFLQMTHPTLLHGGSWKICMYMYACTKLKQHWNLQMPIIIFAAAAGNTYSVLLCCVHFISCNAYNAVCCQNFTFWLAKESTSQWVVTQRVVGNEMSHNKLVATSCCVPLALNQHGLPLLYQEQFNSAKIYKILANGEEKIKHPATWPLIVCSHWEASSLEIPVLDLRYVTCGISYLSSVKNRPLLEIICV